MRDPDDQLVSLYLVADGHGPFGHFVSEFVKETFPEIFKQILTEAY
jgi:serine/threonine protein phosphatase PrpC